MTRSVSSSSDYVKPADTCLLSDGCTECEQTLINNHLKKNADIFKLFQVYTVNVFCRRKFYSSLCVIDYSSKGAKNCVLKIVNLFLPQDIRNDHRQVI